MDTKLATYLYGDELLYATKPVKPAAKEIKIGKVEVALVREEKPIAEKVVLVVPKEVEKPIVKEVKPEEASPPLPIQKDDLVFEMKTHHLFVFSGLDTSEKDFLLKILQALDLSFAKVDLLDIKKEPLVDFKETIHENTIRTIIFFGEEGGKDFLPKLKLPAYEIKNLKNINFLYVDRLQTVAANEANEKRKLWDTLKSLFQN